MYEKQCKGPCGLIKPLNEFGKEPRTKNGFQSRCKKCCAVYHKTDKIRYGKWRRIVTKRRGISNELSFDDWLLIRSAPQCACCGYVFSITDDDPKNRIKTIDRVDSSAGYTINNSRCLCYQCNNLKSFNSIETLEMIILYIKRNKELV